MKLLRLGAPGSERPAVLADDGHTYDLTGLTRDIEGPFLAADGVDRVCPDGAFRAADRTAHEKGIH